MLFMLSYEPFPGKATEALRLREEWHQKYSEEFRKRIKVVQEFADPCALRGYLLLDVESEDQLGQLLVLRSVFGDAVEFDLHPAVDLRKAIDRGVQEPSHLL